MSLIVGFVVGAIVGFAAGALVYRKNSATLEPVIDEVKKGIGA